MDKVAPLYHPLNPSLYQNPAAHNSKLTSCSPTHSLALGAAYPSLETQLSTSSPALPSSLPSLSSSGLPHSFLDDLKEVKSLASLKVVHARLLKMSSDCNSDTSARCLISSYLKFCDFRSATVVFFVGFARNYVLWTSFLEEFESCGGDAREVLGVFGELHGKGVVCDHRVLTLVLKLCANVLDLWSGLAIHAVLIKRGFDKNVYTRCALIYFYETCLGMESVGKVFDETADKEDLLWNAGIMVNLRNERWEKSMELFREMQFSSAKANSGTIAKMLQACAKIGALDEARQIHGYVLKSALRSDLSICNSLINIYSRNSRLELARRVFDLMGDHNLSSWNTIISSYAARGYLSDAWDLLNEMELSGINPDIVTWNCLLSGNSLHGSNEAVLMILQRMQAAGFRPNSSSVSSVLQAITRFELLNYGKEIHAYVIRNGLDCDVYVGSSLLDMYVKNDCLTSAQAVFDNMDNRNIVAWNALISGYSFKGLFEDAKNLLNGMEKEGIKPDLVTWNTLISGYSLRGCYEEALDTIHQIKCLEMAPNVVSWTALISGSSQNGNHRESLEFFLQMQQDEVKPNSATISSLLRTFAALSLLKKGKEIHSIILRNAFIEDKHVSTALIDMYSKSGDLRTAHQIFRMINNKTLVSWNCMITGFSIYGFGKEVILLFDEMRGSGLTPDAITFTALLSGCKNSGLVDEGWKYFDSMSKDFNITPTIEHYSCMVDLLGRAGYIDEAWDFIQSMPFKPDASIWGALLGACRIHKNMEFAENAAKKLFELEPYNSANYVLMLSLYAMSKRWEDVESLKALMSKKGVKIGHGWSWIHIDQTVHLFSTEASHPDEGEIYFELYHLVSEMKKLGYVPDVSCVYQNVDEAEKEKMLLSHTEKLAITFGLMKSKNNAVIRVFKNTRLCSDCHNAAKYMSLVRSQEILLREGSRFHHFSKGKCSCNDCW